MAQACIDQKKLRSNQCKFCSNPRIEETSCISCNPTDDQKWTIGVVKHIQHIGNNVKNSKNDGGNKKENGKKISTKTKKSKLSKSKSTESYYHNGCFYDDIKAIVDKIESGKIDQTKEDQEESHKKLSESIDVIVFEKELNENNDVNDKKICKGINEKEDFEGDLDDNDSFIATCHPCGINFNDNDEDSVNKRFREHEKICKVKNEKEDVEGDLDDNDNDNNYQEEEEEEEEDNDFFFIINELLIDEIKNDSSMTLKEKSNLLKPLEKMCKDNNEKEDVEGDLDDNDKKIKKMQMKNQNCKSPPPPPPPTPTKGPSNFLKPHRPTKTMKAVVKIRKLLPSPPSRKKLFYPSPTKGSFNLLKPHREQYYKLKEMIEKIKLFSDKEKSNKEENEVINHQRVEVSIHIQSKSRQAEFESEDIVPPNIETSPCEEVGNRPSFPRTLSIFHKSMRCKKGIKRKLNLDEENFEYPKKKKMTKTKDLTLIIDFLKYEKNVELDKKKMKMKINKMRNFLKFNIDEDVSQPNVHQIIPPASNNFSVDLHLDWIQRKLRKNRIYYASQRESEKEVINSSNIETPPEGMDNTQQLSTRSLSPDDQRVPIRECLFFFHKSMLRKQGTKRKFNLDEDDNEENVEPPKKMMRMGMKIMWKSGTIHWGRLGHHHRSQRRDIIIKKF